MLIKKENDNRLENEHVKFVSYTGSYPNLCSGTLTLIIDNEKCVFTGYKTDEKNNKYPRFWESGGSHVGLTMIGMIIVTRVNGKSMKIKYLKNIVDTQKI